MTYRQRPPTAKIREVRVHRDPGRWLLVAPLWAVKWYRGSIMPKRGQMPRYRVTGGPSGTAGIDYKSKRAEVGDVVDDIPRESIKWLREQGYIELIGKDDADLMDGDE